MKHGSILKNFLLTAAAVAIGTAGVVGVIAAQGASLGNPTSLKETAPATFNVKFDTSAGVFVVTVTRDWAPNGADRFYNLVKHGWFTEARFFRVVPGFMVQWGLNGNPALNRAWQGAQIQDDPVKQGNVRGTITFANTGAPNSRGTQMFINYKDNDFLNAQRFAAFGKVTTGMDVVDKIYSGDRENPAQDRITTVGNAYLKQAFPKLDFIKTATIEGAAAPAAAAPKK